MLSALQLDFLTTCLFKKNQTEICGTGNVRIKGHIEFDSFQELMSFCEQNKIVFTLGEDGVLVVHD